jgi:hypothetical protein
MAVKPDRVPHQTVACLNRTRRLALLSTHTLREGDGRNSARFRAKDLAWDTARELVFEYERRKLGAFAASCFSAQNEDLVGGENLKNSIAVHCDWKGLALLLWREVSMVLAEVGNIQASPGTLNLLDGPKIQFVGFESIN